MPARHAAVTKDYTSMQRTPNGKKTGLSGRKRRWGKVEGEPLLVDDNVSQQKRTTILVRPDRWENEEAQSNFDRDQRFTGLSRKNR